MAVTMAACDFFYSSMIHLLCSLTYWGQVSKLSIIDSDNCLSPCRYQVIKPNQWWNIVNWTPRNKLQWNIDLNSYNFIQENAFQNVVYKWQPYCLGLNVLNRVCHPGWNTHPSLGSLQCWKFPQVRQPEADSFGGGAATFCWFFFNFMFMIGDSRHEDLQLFWLSLKQWSPITLSKSLPLNWR